MKEPLRDFNYRIEKSKEAYSAAKILAQNKSWNACINRPYYSCFYIVSALLLENKIKAQTHSGVRTQFSLHFVKTGKVDKEFGQLYSDLIDSRQKGDYDDMFDFDQKAVESLIEPVGKFIATVENLIK